MRFEKWQALGNDYVIVEADALPFELTPARVRALCAPHTGVGADGILLLSEHGERGFVAALRIFNPDGSEAELSGNGVREAVMYLRRSGWADSDSFSISTAAGEVRPRITGAATCTVDMGRARLHAPDFPSGGADGTGIAHGRRARAGVPVRVDRATRSARSRWGRTWSSWTSPGSARRSRATSCFPTAPTSRSGGSEGDGRHQGADLRARGGGDHVLRHGRDRRRGGGGAAGADSPVTVRLDGGELEVEVGEDLHVDLTGWAVPVYAGELSDEFLEVLKRT